MDAHANANAQEAEDCPICYGELGTPADLCPNGHKVCDICRPHILRGGDHRGPRCPLCREPLRREHLPIVPRPDVEVDLAAVYAARQAHEQWVAEHAPNRNANGQGHGRGGCRPRGAEWVAARERFLAAREAGTIPADAVFGGIHDRRCGHRHCPRIGGAGGVRFLLFGNTGKRRYRCEAHTEA